MIARRYLWSAAAAALSFSPVVLASERPATLTVSENQRFLEAGGEPFFWMGDTAWLLLSRLNREETEHYLSTRQAQGFNVVQVMILHTAQMESRNGSPALIDGDPGQPLTTPGADPAKACEYDYWDHLDWVVERAAAHGIYLAMVPAWGDIADQRALNFENAGSYGRFLANRYGDKPNVIWLNGGDTRAENRTKVWEELGSTIKRIAPDQLMTFHPIGRTASSWQYHEAPWLDFNMFQSGHRSYAQEGPHARAEDNWRYVAEDYGRTPVKPTIDGEPSYENIPHGLHEENQPRWQAEDARRYAWWAVMAGAFGHTYGENNVMQMYVAGAPTANFEADTRWDKALLAPGALQMHHLRALIEAYPMLERVPDQSLIVDNGTRYDRVLASRGEGYLFAYSYTGAPFTVAMGKTSGDQLRARWFSPRDGSWQTIGRIRNSGTRLFDPPGETANGNDWVLVIDEGNGA